MFKTMIKCIVGIWLLTLGYSTAYAKSNEITPAYEKLDSYIEKEMKECRIQRFALGIVKGNQIIYLKGYGNAVRQEEKLLHKLRFNCFTK